MTETMPRNIIEPDSRAEAQCIADEQFVHGLLEHLHRDDRAAQTARIASVMRAIRSEVRPRRTGPAIRTSWRSALAAAASIVLVATIITLGLPTEQSAYAMVQASLDASRTAGNRRYEIRVVPPGEDASGQRVIAELDIQDPQHVVIRAAMRRGQRIVVGRNPAGAWAVRPDGTVVRFDRDHDRPRWVAFDQTSVLVESVDELLEQLRQRYRLEIDEADAGASLDGAPMDHIVATREAGPEHRPDRIDLWIHPGSRIVQRMELQWSGPRPGDGLRDRRRGARDGWRDRRREMMRNRAQPTDGPAGEADDGRAAPPRWRSDRRRTPGDDDRPFRDRPHRGHQPRGGVEGAPPPPCFVDGPPRFGDGLHPPPPRVIVFELIESPEFPADWFDPSAHTPID